MAEVSMCHVCGTDFEKSLPLDRGSYSLHDTGEIYFEGKRLPITLQEGRVLYALARVAPRPLRAEMLGERVSDCTNPYKLANVLVSHIRRKLRAADIKPPFDTVWGLGFAWTHNVT